MLVESSTVFQTRNQLIIPIFMGASIILNITEFWIQVVNASSSPLIVDLGKT